MSDSVKRQRVKETDKLWEDLIPVTIQILRDTTPIPLSEMPFEQEKRELRELTIGKATNTILQRKPITHQKAIALAIDWYNKKVLT